MSTEPTDCVLCDESSDTIEEHHEHMSDVHTCAQPMTANENTTGEMVVQSLSERERLEAIITAQYLEGVERSLTLSQDDDFGVTFAVDGQDLAEGRGSSVVRAIHDLATAMEADIQEALASSAPEQEQEEKQ